MAFMMHEHAQLYNAFALKHKGLFYSPLAEALLTQKQLNSLLGSSVPRVRTYTGGLK